MRYRKIVDKNGTSIKVGRKVHYSPGQGIIGFGEVVHVSGSCISVRAEENNKVIKLRLKGEGIIKNSDGTKDKKTRRVIVIALSDNESWVHPMLM